MGVAAVLLVVAPTVLAQSAAEAPGLEGWPSGAPGSVTPSPVGGDERDAPSAAEDARGLGAVETLPPARVRFEAHLGQRWLARGLPERAAEHLERVTAAAPGHPGGWYLLSRARQESGRYGEALAAAERAIAAWQALPLHRQGGFDAALFRYQRASLLATTGRLEEAEIAASEAISGGEDAARWHRLLGQLRLELGRDEGAVASLERAVALEPERGDAWLALGKAYLRRERVDDAERALSRAAELAPDDPQVPYSVAALHRVRGDFERQEEALAQFEQLRGEREQRRAQAHEADEVLRRAARVQASGDCEQAVELLREAQELEAVRQGFRRVRLLTDLARCEVELGDAAAAARHYREALASRPTAYLANRELGTLLASRGFVEEAMPHLLAASAIEPFDAGLHADLSTAYGQLGRLNDALAEIRKAVTLEPENLELRQRLVDLEWAVGHRVQARAIASRLGGVVLPGDIEAGR